MEDPDEPLHVEVGYPWALTAPGLWRRRSSGLFQIVGNDLVIIARGRGKGRAPTLVLPLSEVAGIRRSAVVSWIYLSGAERDPLYLHGANRITGYEALQEAGVPVLPSPAARDIGLRRPWAWAAPLAAAVLSAVSRSPIPSLLSLVCFIGFSAIGPNAGATLRVVSGRWEAVTQ